jgi:hypothetical protein
MVEEIYSFLPTIKDYHETFFMPSLSSLKKDGKERRYELMLKIYKRAMEKYFDLFIDPDLDIRNYEDFLFFIEMLLSCLKPYSQYLGERKLRKKIYQELKKMISIKNNL